MKCCRSTPRCRNCPARLYADERVLRAIGIEMEPLPPHLRGVPPSLHKYEPLLKKSWLGRAPERAGSPS